MADWKGCELENGSQWYGSSSPETDAKTAKDYADQAKTYKDAANASAISAATSLSSVSAAVASAVSTIGQAKSSAVDAVTSAKSTATDAVDSAKTSAISSINSAKSAAISTISSSASGYATDIANAKTSAVTYIGSTASTQVSAVQTEGSTQVFAVTAAGNTELAAIAAAHVDVDDAIARAEAAATAATSAAATAAASAITTHNASVESHQDIRTALTSEATARTAADVTLSSGYASLSADLASTKKALKIAQRDIENLQDAARGTLYKDIEDSRTLHSKTLGDAEVCGSDTTVLPNGLLNSIGGRTVVWNQLFNKENYVTITHNGITYTRNENGYKVTGTASSNSYYGIFTMPADNHKYFISGCPNGGSTSTYMIRIADTIGGTTGYDIGSGVVINNTNGIEIFMRVLSGVTIDAQFMPLVTDLTQLTMPDLTSDAFEALIDTTKYHPYNAGTLMSLPTKSVQIDGKNLFDRSNPKSGYYFDDGFHIANADLSGWVNYKIPVLGDTDYRAKCFSGSNHGGTYCAYLDANKDFISQAGSNYFNDTGYSTKSYHTPVNCRYIAFCGFTSDVYEMSLVKGTSYPTTYTPKCRLTLDVPQSVKALTGYGWSAGSVCNEVDWQAKTYTQRVGKVDLGTLAYRLGYGASNDRLYTTSLSSVINWNRTINCITSNFTSKLYNGTFEEKTVSIEGSSKVLIFSDSSYTDAAAFKTAMSGVYLYYELATPVVTDISDILPDNLLSSLETGGTVTFVADGVDPSGTVVLTSDEQSIPVPSTIAYQTKIAS